MDLPADRLADAAAPGGEALSRHLPWRANADASAGRARLHLSRSARRDRLYADPPDRRGRSPLRRAFPALRLSMASRRLRPPRRRGAARRGRRGFSHPGLSLWRQGGGAAVSSGSHVPHDVPLDRARPRAVELARGAAATEPSRRLVSVRRRGRTLAEGFPAGMAGGPAAAARGEPASPSASARLRLKKAALAGLCFGSPLARRLAFGARDDLAVGKFDAQGLSWDGFCGAVNRRADLVADQRKAALQHVAVAERVQILIERGQGCAALLDPANRGAPQPSLGYGGAFAKALGLMRRQLGSRRERGPEPRFEPRQALMAAFAIDLARPPQARAEAFQPLMRARHAGMRRLRAEPAGGALQRDAAAIVGGARRRRERVRGAIDPLSWNGKQRLARGQRPDQGPQLGAAPLAEPQSGAGEPAAEIGHRR